MKTGKTPYLGIKTLEHLRFSLGLTQGEWNAVLARPAHFYREFQADIRGKMRDLVDVKPPLKNALRKLNARLQQIELPLYMQGGVKGRSSVTNALAHTGADAVLKADIKDFFPSIGFQRVEAMCRTRLHCSAKVATAMATLCTHKDALPQGAPTSTIVANFVIEHLAFRLHRLAEKHGAKYSQYVDDIAISGPRHVDELKPLVAKIIEEEGFICHPDKLIILRAGDEHEITGVRVDHGKDVPSKKLKDVRAAVEALGVSTSPPSDKDNRSLDGKVRHVATLNPGTGKFLRRRLIKARRGDAFRKLAEASCRYFSWSLGSNHGR